jgi:hypothetical protein
MGALVSRTARRIYRFGLERRMKIDIPAIAVGRERAKRMICSMEYDRL